MDAALVLSLLRHWRGIVEGAERADVCVDMMRREEQNAGGEEERGIKKKEILLSTKRSGVAILTSQMIKKSPNNSKTVQNICLRGHVHPE